MGVGGGGGSPPAVAAWHAESAWSNTIQTLVTHWSSAGQTMVKHRSSTAADPRPAAAPAQLATLAAARRRLRRWGTKPPRSPAQPAGSRSPPPGRMRPTRGRRRARSDLERGPGPDPLMCGSGPGRQDAETELANLGGAGPVRGGERAGGHRRGPPAPLSATRAPLWGLPARSSHSRLRACGGPLARVSATWVTGFGQCFFWCIRCARPAPFGTTRQVCPHPRFLSLLFQDNDSGDKLTKILHQTAASV